MDIQIRLRNFVADDSGAVTVDWVVLTAAVVGLAMVVIASVRIGTQDVGDKIQASLTTASIADVGDLSQ